MACCTRRHLYLCVRTYESLILASGRLSRSRHGPRRQRTAPRRGWPDWRQAVAVVVRTNLGWKASRRPFEPGRFGDRLYLGTRSESGEMEQERLMCFNATAVVVGAQVRTCPRATSAAGMGLAGCQSARVFAMRGDGPKPDGGSEWERSLAEVQGCGRRTADGCGRRSSMAMSSFVAPIVFRCRGQTASPAHRFVLDKNTGTNWVAGSAKDVQPTQSTNPYVADVDGAYRFSGGSDGCARVKIATGGTICSKGTSASVGSTPPL